MLLYEHDVIDIDLIRRCNNGVETARLVHLDFGVRVGRMGRVSGQNPQNDCRRVNFIMLSAQSPQPSRR